MKANEFWGMLNINSPLFSVRLFLGTLACSAGLVSSATAIPGPQPIPVPVVRSSAPSKQIQILNEDQPGRMVDVLSNLVPGKTNIVVFFADW